MLFCEKCDTEYEREEGCMCRVYLARCRTGQKNRVPLWWKREWWDGYINDPEDCEHVEIDERKDGSRRCLHCGEKFDPPDDDDDGDVDFGWARLAFG